MKEVQRGAREFQFTTWQGKMSTDMEEEARSHGLKNTENVCFRVMNVISVQKNILYLVKWVSDVMKHQKSVGTLEHQHFLCCVWRYLI